MCNKIMISSSTSGLNVLLTKHTRTEKLVEIDDSIPELPVKDV